LAIQKTAAQHDDYCGCVARMRVEMSDPGFLTSDTRQVLGPNKWTFRQRRISMRGTTPCCHSSHQLVYRHDGLVTVYPLRNTSKHEIKRRAGVECTVAPPSQVPEREIVSVEGPPCHDALVDQTRKLCRATNGIPSSNPGNNATRHTCSSSFPFAYLQFNQTDD
jgi:hypothetical protein